jgi:hypothetical protein
MDNVTQITSDLWNEPEAAALVEPPLNIKPFYDDMISVTRMVM